MTRRPFLWIAALALSGVAAGHSVAYVLAVPRAGARNALLAATGHSYWNVAVTTAVLAELAGVFALTVRHFRAGRAGAPCLRLSFPRLTGRLAAMQVAAFSALEVAERVRSGVPVGEMFHNHLFPIGVVIQLLVAAAGALLLLWLARAAESIGSLLGRKRPPRRAVAGLGLPVAPDVPARSACCEALRGRAPPAPLALLP